MSQFSKGNNLLLPIFLSPRVPTTYRGWMYKIKTLKTVIKWKKKGKKAPNSIKIYTTCQPMVWGHKRGGTNLGVDSANDIMVKSRSLPLLQDVVCTRVDCIRSSYLMLLSGPSLSGGGHISADKWYAPPTPPKKSENHLSALMCPPPDRGRRWLLVKRSRFNPPSVRTDLKIKIKKKINFLDRSVLQEVVNEERILYYCTSTLTAL